MDKKTTALLIGCSSVAVLMFLLLAGGLLMLGMAAQNGWLAPIDPVKGEDLPDTSRQKIAKIVELRPDEEILYFYSSGFTIEEDGNLFTNQRVISYQSDEATYVYEADYEEIEDIQMVAATDWLDFETIEITVEDGDYFNLYIDTTEASGKEFPKELLKNWNAKKKTATEESVAD